MNIILKIIVKCRERYEDMIDHCSYAHNLSSCEFRPEFFSGFNFTTA